MQYKSKLPASPEAEQAILGSILQSGIYGENQAFEFIVESGLKPHHFFNKLYREFYEVFLGLREQNRTINTMTFSESPEARCFDAVNGSALLVQFVDSLQFPPNNEKALKETIDILIEKFQRRSLINHHREQEAYIFDATTETELALSKYEQAMSDFDVTTADDSGMKTVGETIMETYALIERELEGESDTFLETPWSDFNTKFGGIPHGLTVVAGRPAMGKTAAALTLALETAKKGKHVIFFSLEMPTVSQLNKRLISMVSGINGMTLLKPNKRDFTPAVIEKHIAAISSISILPLVVDDDARTVEEIKKKVQAWSRKKGFPPDLVIIDYLQILESEKTFKDGYSKTTYLSKEVTRFASGFRVTPASEKTPIRIVCLSQLSRDVESRNNKRPMQSDLRESGQIEQDASLIVMLYRDEYYNPATQDIGIAEMICVKNRNAPVGTIKTLFQAETTTLHNLAQGY